MSLSIPSLPRSYKVSYDNAIKPGKNMAVLSSLVNSIVTGKENKMAVKSTRNSNIISISSKMANIPPEIVQRCPPSMVMTSVVRHISPFSDIILDDDSSASSTGASVVTDRVEKSVQFNQKCYVKKTISRHNYTPQEIGDCWFSDEEYHETRSECIEKIQMLEGGEELSGINDCVWGLDTRTQSATIAKQNNRLVRCSIGRPQRAICKRWSRNNRRRVL